MAWDALPGERIAYDLDGSMGTFSLVTATDRAVRVLSQEALEGLNSDRSKGLYLDHEVMLISGNHNGLGEFDSNYLARPWIAIIFPSPMRLRGVFAALRLSKWGSNFANQYYLSGNMRTAIEVSFDTTNGEDGSWTLLTTCWGAPGGNVGTTQPGYVDAIDENGSSIFPSPGSQSTFAMSNSVASQRHRDAALNSEEYGVKAVSGVLTRNVKAVRIHVTEYSGVNYPQASWTGPTGTNQGPNFAGILVHFHLYGEPDDNALDDRLEFVTEDGIASKNFEWGDVTHGQELTQTFKIRNLSPTLTAESIDISLTPPNPGNSPNPTLELSLNGVIYSSSLSLSDIPAASDSAIIYVRLTVPTAGIVGGFTPRLLAEVGSWT